MRMVDGRPPNSVNALLQSADGKLWVGTNAGLGELIPGNGKRPERFRTYTAAQGLGPLGRIAEDAAGNLWLATLKWVRTGFITYDVQDGLRSNAISSIFEDRQGHLCAVTEDTSGRGHFINRLEGQRFIPTEPKVPATLTGFTTGWNQIHFQNHTGVWWIATGAGLCRYPKVRRVEDLAHTLPEIIYTKHDGLAGDDVFRLYEDSRGDVWISVAYSGAVTRWSRADETFHNYAKNAEGKALGAPLCFAEDRAGNLWMGFMWHNLARYRHGRFDVFTAAEGLPPGVIRAIYADRAGRLWLATSRGGLLRLDDPSAERPRFIGCTTAQGLSSNETNCITEDDWGRIYVGTGRGVDRLDPETGRIQHFTTAEGLPSELPARVAFRDRQGALIVRRVSRLLPQPEQPQSPPPIRITSIRLRGTPYAASELGETALGGPTLDPNQNQI